MSQIGPDADLLGGTARWMAAVRARETQREDALVRDPWAAVLAGEKGRAWLAARPPESTTPIILRTRYFDSAMLTSPITRPWIEMQAQAGAPWVGVLNDPVAFLAARGWDASLSQAGQPDAHHGRWSLPVIPVTQPNMPHNWFVTAQRHG